MSGDSGLNRQDRELGQFKSVTAQGAGSRLRYFSNTTARLQLASASFYPLPCPTVRGLGVEFFHVRRWLAACFSELVAFYY